ncbi:hypothetical protein BDM02DRAFT_3117031 [Thelephora ganbajun]|uniref:Uncharacterized protein n=1 Tax=Thelephora ganbajun TaxID=370292 RepID=A0ACB6ZD31_THEGA|nr:hypothetical protein BDM02DRAFT_3117031 [Thelephora ganbajun]
MNKIFVKWEKKPGKNEGRLDMNALVTAMWMSKCLCPEVDWKNPAPQSEDEVSYHILFR